DRDLGDLLGLIDTLPRVHRRKLQPELRAEVGRRKNCHAGAYRITLRSPANRALPRQSTTDPVIPAVRRYTARSIPRTGPRAAPAGQGFARADRGQMPLRRVRRARATAANSCAARLARASTSGSGSQGSPAPCWARPRTQNPLRLRTTART